MTEQANHKTNPRWGDLLSVILLIIIFQIAAGRLVATLWTKYLSLVQVTAFIGTLLGLALGKSIFKRFWVWFFTLAYGICLIPWQLGLTLNVETTWLDRLTILQVRLNVVIQELLLRKPVTDSILFLLLMASLFWILSVSAGVVLMREANPWKVILPGGITVFVIHTFDPLLVSRSWYLAFYLFFSLLLVARLVYVKNNFQWQERRTHTPPDIGFDFIRVALILSMVLVFFAWNVPVVAETFRPAVDIWQTTTRPWLTAKDKLSFMFASLRASVGLVQNFYGSSLQLGLGTPLSDTVIFEVQGPTDSPGGDRFYWEARTYDTYDGTQWLSTIQTKRDITSSSRDLEQPGAESRPTVTFTFFPHDPISNLITVPEPLWVSIPSTAYIKLNPDRTIDYSTLMSQGFVHPGNQYDIRSAIDAATIIDLQTAGTDYPKWVTDEYLQLPPSITARTKELAKTIAGKLTNPYDIVNAITEYLRNNITYTQSISTVPANQDRIDWFLFDYKKGFCNYYASAEVILLRSLGIPARMAVGFAQGERQENIINIQPPVSGQNIPHERISTTSTYVVRQRDAHAWPEVFFPGAGWVIFEPTVSQPPLFRPSGDTSNSPNERQPGAEANNPQNPSNAGANNQQKPGQNERGAGANGSTNFWTAGNIIKLIILIFAVLALAFIIWQYRRGFRLKPFIDRVSIQVPERLERGLRRLGIRPPDFLVNWIYLIKLPTLSRSYLEINRALKRIGKPPEVQDTPRERAAALVSALPATDQPTQRLLSEYQTSIYSPHRANVTMAVQAGKEIRKISWLAWFNRILSGSKEPQKK